MTALKMKPLKRRALEGAAIAVVSCCLALSSLAPSSSAQPLAERAKQSGEERRYSAAIADTESLAKALVESGLPSVSMAVAVDGEVVWADAFGLADLTGKPATTATRYRIGSTSKPVTTALAGRMLDRGVVDFDFLVDLPEEVFPKKSDHLTLEHLLSNQGGVRHYQGAEYISNRHYESLSEGLTIFRDDPLLFEPGSQFHYSSYGFNLAAVVMEHAAGRNYLDLLSKEVLKPLAMGATGPDDVTVEIPERASFYSDRGEAPIPTLPVDDSYKYPSGGLLSTPTDMVVFGSSFLQAGFFKEDTLRSLTRARSTSSGNETGYALGWRVRDPDENLPFRALHHGGSSMGARSMLVVVPEKGVVVSILTNSDGYKTKEEDAFRIARLFSSNE